MFYKIFISSIYLIANLSFYGIDATIPEASAHKDRVSKLASSIDSNTKSIYNSLQASGFDLPTEACFTQALKAYMLCKQQGFFKKEILTLIDFSLSSNEKRLWIINLSTNEILLQSLVAHGKNTGNEFANKFSNSPESFKSSLGLFATAEVYNGKHGLSLRLDGLEKGINDQARQRAIVLHGADYVSDSFIRENRRLGRSQGCPAVPRALSRQIIDIIKHESCLYIYHPSLSPADPARLLS